MMDVYRAQTPFDPPKISKKSVLFRIFFTVYGRFGFEIIGLTLPLTNGQTRFAIERNSQQEKLI